MKITPIEIRQKDFEKTFRGYDKEEVDAFLQAMSQEWERALDEIKELRKRLEQSEAETSRLRDVEHSLFKTLKTAEDTGASLIDQANKSAALHLKEAQMNAEAVLNEARTKARAMVEEAEAQSRLYFEELQEEAQRLKREFQDIQNLRENLLHDIQSIVSDFSQKAQRYADKPVSQVIEKKVKQLKNTEEKIVKTEAVKREENTLSEKGETMKPVDKETPASESPSKSNTSNAPKKGNENASFFDSI